MNDEHGFDHTFGPDRTQHAALGARLQSATIQNDRRVLCFACLRQT